MPVWCLRNNYTFAAMDFGRRLGASDEHIPKWICKERATTPPLKRHAALRVALKLAWGFVAQSAEYRWGYTSAYRDLSGISFPLQPKNAAQIGSKARKSASLRRRLPFLNSPWSFPRFLQPVIALD